MLDFLLAPCCVPFTAALALMAVIGAVEAAGLGGAHGIDIDAGADARPLGWLGAGRVPMLVLIVLGLFAFGAGGLVLQRLADAIGGPLPLVIAVPAAAIAALPLTAMLSRAAAAVLPRDETSAVHLDELVGRAATLVVGRAAPGSPARARVLDRFGMAHFIMVEPDNDGQSFAEGEEVLIVRRDAGGFRAIATGRHLLPKALT